MFMDVLLITGLFCFQCHFQAITSCPLKTLKAFVNSCLDRPLWTKTIACKRMLRWFTSTTPTYERLAKEVYRIAKRRTSRTMRRREEGSKLSIASNRNHSIACSLALAFG